MSVRLRLMQWPAGRKHDDRQVHGTEGERKVGKMNFGGSSAQLGLRKWPNREVKA